MKYLLFVMVLLGSALIGTSEAQVRLDCRQCRAMALENSRQMAIAGKQREKALYTTRSVKAGFFPRLSATGLGFYNREEYSYKLDGGYLPTYVSDAQGQLRPNVKLDPVTGNPMTGPDGRPVFNEYAFLPDIGIKIGMRGVYVVGVQVEQPVYLGGKVRAAYRMALTGEEIAEENIRFNRSEVLLATDKAYWRLVQVQEQVEAAGAYYKVVRELLKTVSNSQEVGMLSGNDVLKVQVRCNEAELMLQKARNGLELSRMDLCRLIGLPLETQLHLEDSLPETTAPGLLEEEGGLEQRPDYSLLKQEVELHQRQIDLTRSGFLPQIGVSIGGGYSGGLELNGSSDAGVSLNLLASVRVPLFYWGEGRNKIKVARTEQEMSQLNLEESAQLMRLEIAAARFNIQDAQTRIKMAKNALLQAEDNLRISNDQYKVGMERLTNLLEAQAQWQEAQTQWVEAKAALRISETQYLKSIGRLAE